MKIAVIGAGVVGMLTAYYLARRGFPVTVYDREDGPAKKASSANASQLAYDSIYPISGPDVLSHVPDILLGRDPAAYIAGWYSPQFWCWLSSFLPSCLSFNASSNLEKLKTLSSLSRDLFSELKCQFPMDFSFNDRGRIQLYGDHQKFTAAAAAVRNRSGFRLLSPAECVEFLPFIAGTSRSFAGGILSTGDFSGDCSTFCRILKSILADKFSVKFKFGEDITSVQKLDNGNFSLISKSGVIDADAFVVATGAWTTKLLRKSGVRLNMIPVAGCTVILPYVNSVVLDYSLADIDNKLIGVFAAKVIKFSSGMRFGGFDETRNERFFDHIKRSALSLNAGLDFSAAEIRTGFRPATPTGLPIVKRYGRSNLFLNTGHGMWGWTLAPVTGKMTTELIEQAL